MASKRSRYVFSSTRAAYSLTRALHQQLSKYEVLVGDQRALRWVQSQGRLSIQNLGARPVEGGREKDGTPLFIASAQHGPNVIPGKVSERLDGTLHLIARRHAPEANGVT